MGGIGVRAEDAARDQHFDGGLFHIHHADLAAAGLGAQHDVIGHIEGVLHIAGGVILGHIQAGEVVVVILDLGTFVDLKAHAGENVDDLVLDESDGMQAAVQANLRGHGDVHGFGGVAGSQGSLLHLDGQGLILALGPLLELVDGLANGRTILFGHIAQGLGQPGNSAVFAQEFLPEVRQLCLIGDSGGSFFNRRAQLFDFLFHSTPLFMGLAGQNKKASSLCLSGTKPCTSKLRGTTRVPHKKGAALFNCR